MDSFPLAVAIALLSILCVLCLFGLFQVQISEVLGTFFAFLLRPFLQINNSLQSFWGGVAAFYREQFLVNGQLDLQRIFFQFIGAVLYTIFFFAFNFSEFHLLALSMTAAGIDAGHFNSPIGAGTLTAFALIASFLFWGAVVLDLCGVTNTAPWREALSERWKKSLFYVALFCLALSLFATSSMGFFRGKVIADESLGSQSYVPGLGGGISGSSTNFSQNNPAFSPQGLSDNSAGVYYWIPIMANVCIPILVGIGGVFASWGVVTLIKFLLLMVVFLIISPLGLFLLASSLLVNIVDRLYQFANALFGLFAEMGIRFMGVFGWSAPELIEAENQDGGADDDQIEGSGGDQETEPAQEPLEGWEPFKK